LNINYALCLLVCSPFVALPAQALMQDCSAYFKATGRRVTFEYTLMNGTNDEPEHVSADGSINCIAPSLAAR
jgi:hypothetical protein